PGTEDGAVSPLWREQALPVDAPARSQARHALAHVGVHGLPDDGGAGGSGVAPAPRADSPSAPVDEVDERAEAGEGGAVERQHEARKVGMLVVLALERAGRL